MGALGAVFGSATGRSRALREQDVAVRAPLPLCRRIGFVQLAPGVGGSTLAAGVAGVLARRRAGMVLAVDASPSPHGLLPLLDVPPGPSVPVHAGTAAEARAALTRAPSGCYTADLRPAAVALRRSPTAVGVGDWAAGVGGIARFFDVIVTDWGLRQPWYDLEPVLNASHAVCLVAGAHAVPGPLPPHVVVTTAGGPHQTLRLAAELMRPTGGDRRDR
jgi:hypothetical protein